jgi:SAM-dependent methyltransferase
MIIQIDYKRSDALLQEMEFFKSQKKDVLIGDIDSIKEYYKKWIDTAGRHSSLLYFFDQEFDVPLKIMDIGVGFGATSTYLADLGHHVTVVEPSMFCCGLIDELSSRFSLNIDIYSCSAESIDQIPENDYDACIFDASLHHSDDPIRALKNCQQKLKPGARLYLLDELRIPFFMSKKRFQEKLLADPVGMGNYGGNEHPYYHNEYLDMLREAGFEQILEILPENYYYPRNIIKQKMNAINLDKYMYSDSKIIIRYIYYLILSKIIKNSFVISILKSLSLIGFDFVAIKI